MADLYTTLKWLHIVSAAIAFGSNVTHFFWLLAAGRNPMHRANILGLVKRIDDRLAVPCYVVAVMCGVAMWLWRWPVNTSWILASLLVTALLSGIGICYGPQMGCWICMAGQPSPDARQFALVQRWLTRGWAALTLAVPGILYLMVFKPKLW